MRIKPNKPKGNRARKRENIRLKRKWADKSKYNRIQYEFERLEILQRQFPKAELRVADCPFTLKPVLQGFMKHDKTSTEKEWHCIHENKTIHKVEDCPNADMIEIYKKELVN